MTHMATLYTPKRVTDLLGISASALRIYCDKYATKLSTEATTTPRKFTEGDLQALAFVVASTKEGKTHGDILAGWDDEYPDFEWDGPQNPTEATGGDNTALVPMAALQAAQALMLDAKRREEETREQAIARERELQEQINQLLRELGMKEGELNALKNKPKGWLARLLGGS
jgi:DNA-binding transcriptional MerR regulator